MRESAAAWLVAGGSFHDFDGFAGVLKTELETIGLGLRDERELDALTRLGAGEPRLLVLYTCLDEVSGMAHRSEEIEALGRWVFGGGSLLAVHATTVSAARTPELARLLGAEFASHPPKARFEVAPVGPPHPSMAGVGSFEIEDELYRHHAAPNGTVHLVAAVAHGAQPLAWSRPEGQGSVYYLALGHDGDAWKNPAFRRILRQAAGWLAFG